LPLWLGLWWVAVEFGCLAHILFSGGVVPRLGQWMKVLSSGMSLAHALILFAPVIPALTTAMVIGNYLVYWVAPARRALNAEAADFPGTEYSTGQRELSRVTAYTAPVALLLSLLGAWLL
jgi:hypothetical protein